MSAESVVLLLVGAWLLVAVAMLWGVLRIARRHHRPARPASHYRPVGASLLAKPSPASAAVSRVRQQAGAYRR